MWIDGHNYKRINFTLLEEKLRDHSKTQTYRMLFIPKFEIGEIVAICFKKEFLYLAKIKDLYPKQLRFIHNGEAELDGFCSLLEFRQKIMELNNINSLNQWGFVIVFEAIPTVMDYFK